MADWSACLIYIQIVLVCIFTQSLAHKLHDIKRFNESVRNYRILHENFISTASLVMILFESIAIIALFFPKLYGLSLIVIFSLLSIFSLAIASALWRHVDITCGCFGDNNFTISLVPLLRNLTLMSFCVIGIYGFMQYGYKFNSIAFVLILAPAIFTAWLVIRVDFIASLIKTNSFKG